MVFMMKLTYKNALLTALDVALSCREWGGGDNRFMGSTVTGHKGSRDTICTFKFEHELNMSNMHKFDINGHTPVQTEPVTEEACEHTAKQLRHDAVVGADMPQQVALVGRLKDAEDGHNTKVHQLLTTQLKLRTTQAEMLQMFDRVHKMERRKRRRLEKEVQKAQKAEELTLSHKRPSCECTGAANRVQAAKANMHRFKTQEICRKRGQVVPSRGAAQQALAPARSTGSIGHQHNEYQRGQHSHQQIKV